MKRVLLAMLLVVISVSSFAQRKDWPRPKRTAETKLEKYNCRCVPKNTYTAVQRRKFYPFNKAAKIKLVSFYGEAEPNQEVRIDGDTSAPPPAFKWKYPFSHNKVDASQFMQTVTLSKAQINKLTDVLFNLDERKHIDGIAYPSAKCFNPRNSIIFLDPRGKIFAHVEICFECGRIETSSDKIDLGPWCLNKMNKILHYFASVGVKYGITTRELPK